MKKGQILETSFKEFSKYGVKKVSVDEIAQKLKISKKTIYEYFAGKDQLIVESFRHQMALQKNLLNEINAKYESPLEAIIRGGLENFKFFYPISEAYKEDLKDNFLLWNECKVAFEDGDRVVRSLIERAVANGEILADENFEILGPLFKSQITNNLEVEELKAKYSPEEICKFTLITIFKGIATPKGRDVLVRIEKENNI